MFERTLRKILSFQEKTVQQPSFRNGKLLCGHASKHRTRSGVKYNNLLRLARRLKMKSVEVSWI
jgi:hypothetical protein